jgi:prolyl-tRNA synthetase
MVHGDDNGLVFHLKLPQFKLVIIPLPGHQKAAELAEKLFNQLKSDYRCHLDGKTDETAGFKFNKWEVKGVPVRIEVGDREAESESVVLVRRDTLEKQTVKISEINQTITKLMTDIQASLLEKHKKFTQDNTFIG